MRHARTIFGASIAVALAVACGSSSNTTSSDGGADGGGGDDSAAPPKIPCSMGDGGPLCASGMVCCMPGLNAGALGGLGAGAGGGGLGNLTSAFMPSCEATCSGSTVQCNDSSNCPSGQVCCAGAPTPDGGAEAGAAAGGFPGLGALASLGMTTCQTSCMPGQQQQCSSSSECTDGQTCQAPNFGGAGGIGALLGGAGGLGFTIPKNCAPPPPPEGGADTGTSPETGTPAEAGPETGSTPESGSPEASPEAGTPEDAAGQ